MRPCARLSPGRAMEWSVRTIAVALQALDPTREEEGGCVLWRRRVLRSASDFRFENRCGTESRRYPSGVHAGERGWLGLPRVLGEMAMAKYFCDDIIGEIGKTEGTILARVGGKIGSSTQEISHIPAPRPVQAGLPMNDNRSKFSPRAQFCSVLADILTVFLTAPYAQICPKDFG